MDATLLQHGFDPNRKCDDSRWNCINYALCNEDAHIVFQDLMKKHNSKNIVEILMKTCQFLEIKAMQIDFVDIFKYEGENVIFLYWYEKKDKRWEYSYIEYHILRKINETWFTKDGHDSKPYVVSDDQIDFILKQLDPEKLAFLVLE